MRGFLIGFFLMVAVIVSVLYGRPGGFRNQLRNVARRLKLALVLAGIYLAVSTVLRLAFSDSGPAEAGMIGVAVVLAIAFLVLGQDRQLER